MFGFQQVRRFVSSPQVVKAASFGEGNRMLVNSQVRQKSWDNFQLSGLAVLPVKLPWICDKLSVRLTGAEKVLLYRPVKFSFPYLRNQGDATFRIMSSLQLWPEKIHTLFFHDFVVLHQTTFFYSSSFFTRWISDSELSKSVVKSAVPE